MREIPGIFQEGDGERMHEINKWLTVAAGGLPVSNKIKVVTASNFKGLKIGNDKIAINRLQAPRSR